jgi:hypothetical protein
MIGGLRPSRSPEAAFALFSALWAAASLFHLASYNQWGQAHWLALAAGWVLLQPGSVPALAALASLQIANAISFSPYIPNHWAFTTAVNVAMLATMAIAVGRRRRARAELADALVPAVRLSLILLYAFAVFHKLNADFFDPQVSCGTELYASERLRWPVLPASLATGMVPIWGALGAEAAIPLLLVFPRTRVAGIMVGLLFHVVLAVNPTDHFYNFSAMLLAALSLFAPAGSVDVLQPLGKGFNWFGRSVLGGVVATLIVSRLVPRDVIGTGDPFFLLWNVYVVVVAGGFLRALWLGRAQRSWPAQFFPVRYAFLQLLPIAVLLNGISPYIGLKTETSWAMFSNLRTEGNVTNPFLVPTRLQIFGYENDLVRIVSSSEAMLARMASRGQLVPYFEIRRWPDATIAYVRNGVEYRFAKASDDPAFQSPIPDTVGRLLLFRPVDAGARQTCMH